MHSSPKSFFNQVFLDLCHFRGGLPQHYKIQFAYEQLAENRSATSHVQFNVPESFRKSLIHELRANQYDVSSPLDLPSELRSKRWELMCDHVACFAELSPNLQIKVVRLLGALGFHGLILEKVPPLSAAQLPGSDDSDRYILAFLRAFSSLLVRNDQSLPVDIDEIQFIAEQAPQGNPTKASAALQLLVISAYSFKDAEAAMFWRHFAEREIQTILPDLDEFTGNLLLSNFCRAASFVPQLQHEDSKLVEEMDRCERHAETLAGQSLEQQYLCHENLNVIIESRAKEALWLKDLELAEQRTRQLIQRCDYEPRYQLELGEILLKRGHISESAKAYCQAARLGPPDTAIAWFMAGQCYQSLGDLEVAYDCYASSIDSDPLAISPVRRIGEIAPLLGNESLSQWSELRLAELETQKSQMESAGSRFQKPRVIVGGKASRAMGL